MLKTWKAAYELSAIVQERETEAAFHKEVVGSTYAMGHNAQMCDVRKREELRVAPKSLALLSGFQDGSAIH